MPDPLGNITFTWPFYMIFIIGYLFGSVPFGLIITKIAGYGDIRKIGSGNIGATNVLRIGNKKIAFLTLALDLLKGFAVVTIINQLLFRDYALLAGVGAILGHMVPIWLITLTRRKIFYAGCKFVLLAAGLILMLAGKDLWSIFGVILLGSTALLAWGGKSVATSLGVLVAVNPLIGGLACTTWLLIAVMFRYSSLAAILTFILVPCYELLLLDLEINKLFLADTQLIEFSVFIAFVILVRHVGNVGRLLKGTESRIGTTDKKLER